jgi:HAMP domain-containing protein
MQEWGRWGVLESGYAPIYSYVNPDRIVAAAGADLDVRIVRIKTSQALAKVGAAALVCLLIGAFLSFAISRRLTRPLAEVKDLSLQVASGQYGHRIEVTGPKELADLAASFNLMRQTLERNARDRADSNRSWEAERRKRDLLLALRRLDDDSLAALSKRRGFVRAEGDAGLSGFVASPESPAALVWIGSAPEDPLRAAKIRCEIEAVAGRLWREYSEDWPSLSARLRDLFADSVDGFLRLDEESGEIRVLARRPLAAIFLEGKRVAKSVDLPDGSVVRWPDGGAVILRSSANRAASPALRFASVGSAPIGGFSLSELRSLEREAGLPASSALVCLLPRNPLPDDPLEAGREARDFS